MNRFKLFLGLPLIWTMAVNAQSDFQCNDNVAVGQKVIEIYNPGSLPHLPNHPPGNVTDLDLDTYWAAGDSGNRHLHIELDDIYTVNQMVVHTGPLTELSQGTVFAHITAVNGAVLQSTETYSYRPNTVYTFTFGGPVLATDVTLRMFGNRESQFSIREIELCSDIPQSAECETTGSIDKVEVTSGSLVTAELSWDSTTIVEHTVEIYNDRGQLVDRDFITPGTNSGSITWQGGPYLTVPQAQVWNLRYTVTPIAGCCDEQDEYDEIRPFIYP